MKKTILLSTIAVLAIFAVSFPSIRSFAGVAGPVNSPSWINCNGQYETVASTGKAYAGTSNVLVAWVAPGHDSQGIWGACWQVSFNEMTFTVQVFHSGYSTATGPTFTSTSTYPPSGITVSINRWICANRICYSAPYILQYGDQVCVREMVFYGAVDYSGGYCYYV